MHALTGVAPSVAVHIPWDKVDDYGGLAAYAREQGVAIGTVNANVFQDDDYKLGSVASPDPAVRAKAVAALLECVDVMDAAGSQDLKLWFADGTNYPGQDDIRGRQGRLAEALAVVYERLGPGQRMLLEYKLFEPSFYATDVPDWGTSLVHCLALGQRAAVVVDTGHHAPGTNIEFIVAMLLRAGRLGGFDFNSRFYADDDLMVGRPTRSSCSGSCTRWSRPARRDGPGPRPGRRLPPLRLRRKDHPRPDRRHPRQLGQLRTPAWCGAGTLPRPLVGNHGVVMTGAPGDIAGGPG